jgi:hypothetical protein
MSKAGANSREYYCHQKDFNQPQFFPNFDNLLLQLTYTHNTMEKPIQQYQGGQRKLTWF